MYPGTRPVDTFDSSFLPQPVILTPNLLRRQIWPRLLRDPQAGAPRAPCIHSHLHPLATIRCEKFGLADSSATVRGQIDP
jgi:hypothetical protein